MKIERKEEKPKFVPVTITIESQEELDWLYASLCTPANYVRENVSKDSIRLDLRDASLRHNMWEDMYNNFYGQEWP